MAIHNLFFALKRTMENKSIAVVGRRLNIHFLEANDSTVACTKQGNTVYINPQHPIAKHLPINKRLFFYEGAVFHEWLHQLFTDFAALTEMHAKLPMQEFPIWMQIANIMEDAAIEHFAPTVAGGTLLHSLRYASAINMSEVSKLSECKNRLSELFSALLQYGRRGAVNEAFSDNEVADIFYESLDDFDACIHEPKAKKRLEYATSVFERSRPIWEKETESNIASVLIILQKAFGEISGTPQEKGCSEPQEVPADTEMDKRRKNARKQEESKRLQKGSQNGAGDPSASDEKGQDKNDRDSQSGSGQESESDCSQKSDAQSSGDQQEENLQGKAAKQNNSKSESGSNDNRGKDESTGTQEEFSPDERYLERLRKELDKCLNEIENEKKTEAYYANKDKNLECFPFLPNHRNTKVVNEYQKDQSLTWNATYSVIVNAMQNVIDDFADRLLDLFTPEYDQRSYAGSGKINIKRAMSGKLTVNMFTKNNSPSDKSDLAVVIMSDCSGSMRSGDKTERAKYCLVAFAEAFGKLDIPIKIIGFQTKSGYEVYHTHCSDWTNPASGRPNIIGLPSYGSNCDGYSIRYGAELLKNRQEKHKVLIIISDGLPTQGGDDPKISPVQDAMAAVIEAKQDAVIIGVGIDGDFNKMRAIYGSSFVAVNNLRDMFACIAERLKNEIERW